MAAYRRAFLLVECLKVGRQAPDEAKKHLRTDAQLREQVDEETAGDFIGAYNATMTAILALEGKDVDTLIATSLRMHVLRPLERIQEAIAGKERQA